MSPAGFLHSDICGSMAICASPQLFAACRVLLRQISPRHPPYALSILTYGTYFVCVHLDLLALSFLQCARKISLNEIFLTLLLYSFQRTIFLLFERVFGSLKTDQYGVKPMTTYTAWYFYQRVSLERR